LRSSAGAIPLSGAAVTHLIDSVPPTVTVLYASPAVLHPGANAVYGQAYDGTVIGVAKVEIRLAGATQWQVVTDTALPAFITSTLDGYTQINGTASNPSPIGGLVSQVDVQTGSDTAPW
jgi:hypothetical protein